MVRDDSGEHVALVEQARHQSAGGPAHHVLEPSRLQRPPVVQHAQPVAEELGLFEVVRDQHHGDADLAAKLHELEPEPPPGELIDGRERLVEQQDPGVARQRSRERDPLALSSGERGGSARFQPFHVDPRQQRPRPRGALFARQMGHRARDVGERIEMRKQRVVLEYQSHPAALRRNRDSAAPVEPDLPVACDLALPRGCKPRDASQHRGLAAPRWADQGKQLARPALERHVERNGVVLAQPHPQAANVGGDRHGRSPAQTRTARPASARTRAMATSDAASSTAESSPAASMSNACTRS